MGKRSPVPIPNAVSGLGLIPRLAISKAKDCELTELERASVQAGEYPVDVTVRVVGTLSVSPDHEVAQVNRINPYELLLVALGKLNGVTVEKLIDEAAANVAGQTPEKAKELEERVKEIAKSIRNITGVTVLRRGAVKFNGVLLNPDHVVDDGGVQVFEGDGKPS
jgi:hypothetical protein